MKCICARAAGVLMQFYFVNINWHFIIRLPRSCRHWTMNLKQWPKRRRSSRRILTCAQRNWTEPKNWSEDWEVKKIGGPRTPVPLGNGISTSRVMSLSAPDSLLTWGRSLSLSDQWVYSNFLVTCKQIIKLLVFNDDSHKQPILIVFVHSEMRINFRCQQIIEISKFYSEKCDPEMNFYLIFIVLLEINNFSLIQ